MLFVLQIVAIFFVVFFFFFFFQAEDGIRDLTVTGVQTCALPIYLRSAAGGPPVRRPRPDSRCRLLKRNPTDRKSTRLNSSHSQISYAVFCLKKKNIVACGRSAHCSGAHGGL